MQLLIARYRAHTRNASVGKPLICPLALTLTTLSLGIGLVLGSDSQVYSPGGIVGVAHAESTQQVVSPRIRFEDVTAASGLGGLLSSSYIHTSSWGDADGDGWLDLFVGTFVGSSFPDSGDPSAKPGPDRLLLNQNGVFQDSG